MLTSPSQTHLQSFLQVYFYTIENKLNQTKNGLEEIKFQSEEANTDEFLKRFFQQFLLDNNSIATSNLERLVIKIDTEENEIPIAQLLTYKVTNVLMPEQLSLEQKKSIAQVKTSVYTNPDLYLEISNGEDVFYESVELKSTKDNNIPGSSVQQVSPYEWVIFAKRNKGTVSVSTGFYINSITHKLPFPDRSPRPQVGFETLHTWNKEHRKEEGNTLLIENISELNEDKLKILTDWQDYLASEWLETIKLTQIKNNEKWFNNTIRKFALQLLKYNDTLSNEAKTALKNKLAELIK